MNLLFCRVCFGAYRAQLVHLWARRRPSAIPAPILFYGKLKQILFPLLTCIAVERHARYGREYGAIFSLPSDSADLPFTSPRGIMLVTFLQMLFLFSLRSSMSRKKQYLLFIGAFVLAIAGMTVIGDLRTAHDIFIAFLSNSR